MGNERIAPIHQGEILLEEFLKPMRISQNSIALDIGVPPLDEEFLIYDVSA